MANPAMATIFLAFGIYLFLFIMIPARGIQHNIRMEIVQRERVRQRLFILAQLPRDYGFCMDCNSSYSREKGGYVCSYCGGLNTEKRLSKIDRV